MIMDLAYVEVEVIREDVKELPLAGHRRCVRPRVAL
jgi:hypothetical protein